MSPFVRQVGDSCYRHPFDMLSVLHKYTIGPNAAKDNTYRDHSYSDCHNFCSCILRMLRIILSEKSKETHLLICCSFSSPFEI